MTDTTSNTQTAEGSAETANERLLRKQTAINDMCRRLENLEHDMIGCDNAGQQLDYIHLTTFMRQVLGMTEQDYPQEFLTVQENLWIILIDRREKCHKDPKDLYYSQTYLGLVGHLIEKEIISGKPQKIMDCLYEKSDQGMVKNLKRGVVSAFPEGTRELLDFYIDQMKKGMLV